MPKGEAARDDVLNDLAGGLALTIEARLPARSNESWRVRRGGEDLVLRRHLDPLVRGHELIGRSADWQSKVRDLAADRGWPAPVSIGEQVDYAGSWWTLEQFLPGQHRPIPTEVRAKIIADWHETNLPVGALGKQPGALDHLAILNDSDAKGVLRSCLDELDRSWLLRRLDQTASLSDGIDWTASRIVLVHGDLIDDNLLWSGKRLTGILDFELATVDRRVTEAVLTWRCRHDDLVFALHDIAPLNEHEWRMLLVDWWAHLLTLASVNLRLGRQPERWELDALRRETPLSRELERSGGRQP